MVLHAGPVVGKGFVYDELMVEANDNEEAKKILKKYGFSFKEKMSYSSTMIFTSDDMGIGYRIMDVSCKLMERPEIKWVCPVITAPRVIY